MGISGSLLHDLSRLPAAVEGRLRLRTSVAGCDLTTFSVGGSLDLLAEPRDLEALRSLLRSLAEHSLPWRVLGAGSNLIIGDDGIRETVIRLGEGFQGATWWGADGDLPTSLVSFPDLGNSSRDYDGELLLVYSAASLMALSRKSAAAGLSGLEFAAGIPATLGGAAMMNAGAHGHSISEIVKFVVVMRQSGEIAMIPAEQVGYGYRHSELPAGSVILGAALALVPGDGEQIREERQRCLDYRKQTQPLHLPSAGSVFANPSPTLAAAKLIEECGYKGRRRGGVMVSPMHANWIVKADESAQARHVLELVDEIREGVYRERDVQLRAEIRFWNVCPEEVSATNIRS